MTRAAPAATSPEPSATRPEPPANRPAPGSGRLRVVWSLVKSRIALLVAVAAALGWWAAAGGFRPADVLLATLAGTALASAGAGVLNNVLDRDVDARMERTRRRALPRGEVSVRAAVLLGTGLIGGGAALLAWRAGPVPALLSLLAAGLYLFAYTPLKRRSWLNTPIGAIPGALPPLIGWSAADGGLGAGAWVLFAVLFLWQHPHVYAIAWACRDDYRAAGLRMAGEVGTGGRVLAAQVVVLLAVLIPVSLLLITAGAAGARYAAGCLVAGGAYLAAGIRFARRRDRAGARTLITVSVLYVPALLVALMLDRL